jgi:peptide/nickel transport system ATP-binding protein
VTVVSGDTTVRGTPLIELVGVTREFKTPGGAIRAVDRVSLALGQSEAMCLVGESGCGKTTTGRLLAGLIRPSSGQLLFEGKDVWKSKGEELARFRRSVQLVHQDPYASLNPIRTVYQTLSAPLFRHKKARGRRAAVGAASELLQRVGLTPPADFLVKYPHQLSGGQRQRVSIARALSVDPRVIVADEAVSMVDVSIRISLLNLLLALRDEFRVTIVLITHDLAVARYFARRGRIGVMYLGRVVELGRSELVVEDPAHPYSAALVAAIPEADPTLTRSKQRVELRSAEVPSLLRLPSGCTFHPRCPLFEEGLCDVNIPALLPIGEAREVACHVAVRERAPAAELLGVR